jgi:tetratricopeptide (TPR) repeat protein
VVASGLLGRDEPRKAPAGVPTLAAAQLDDAEAALRRVTGPAAEPRVAVASLPIALAAQGRRREALEAFEALTATRCGRRCPAPDEVTKLHLLLCGGDLAAAREELARWEPPEGSDLEEHLWLWPWLGLADEGARRAAAATPGTRGERRHASAAALRRGDREGALRILASLAPHDPAVEVQFLLAQALLADGKLEDALEPLARITDADGPEVQRWHASLRGWALLLRARTLARLGDRQAARAQLARLAREWERADRELPLVREAQALARDLGMAFPAHLVAGRAAPG